MVRPTFVQVDEAARTRMPDNSGSPPALPPGPSPRPAAKVSRKPAGTPDEVEELDPLGTAVPVAAVNTAVIPSVQVDPDAPPRTLQAIMKGASSSIPRTAVAAGLIAAAGVVMAPFTGGLSLVVTAIAGAVSGYSAYKSDQADTSKHFNTLFNTDKLQLTVRGMANHPDAENKNQAKLLADKYDIAAANNDISAQLQILDEIQKTTNLVIDFDKHLKTSDQTHVVDDHIGKGTYRQRTAKTVGDRHPTQPPLNPSHHIIDAGLKDLANLHTQLGAGVRGSHLDILENIQKISDKVLGLIKPQVGAAEGNDAIYLNSALLELEQSLLQQSNPSTLAARQTQITEIRRLRVLLRPEAEKATVLNTMRSSHAELKALVPWNWRNYRHREAAKKLIQSNQETERTYKDLSDAALEQLIENYKLEDQLLAGGFKVSNVRGAGLPTYLQKIDEFQGVLDRRHI
ncbi:MAG: hypothetical protein V4534_03735 [Myxococcota bacterium]